MSMLVEIDRQVKVKTMLMSEYSIERIGRKRSEVSFFQAERVN